MHIKIIAIILDKENLLLLKLAVADLIEMDDLYLYLLVETNTKNLHQ